MSVGPAIILLIVIWLFVLAPWLLRGQRPMSHTGEGFDDTRVLFEGGSGDVPNRRRPKSTAGDARRFGARAGADSAAGTGAGTATDTAKRGGVHDDADDEYELVVPATDSEHSRDHAPEGSARPVSDVVDGEVVEEIDAADNEAEKADSEKANATEIEAETDAENASAEEVASEIADAEAEAVEADVVSTRFEVKAPLAADAYAYDDSYTSPVDLLYPGAVDADDEFPRDDQQRDTAESEGAGPEAEATHEPAHAAADEAVDEAVDETEGGAIDRGQELSAEELAFAQRRLGRGGWDPVADKKASTDRYQRRQRTLIILAVIAVGAVALGIVLGGWWWTPAVVAGVAVTLFLIALRTQVRQEQALRARRIRQLRRARLGVRNAADEELAIPRQLRHPGAIVLEADDESPDFDYLPVVEDYEVEVETRHFPSRRPRRDDLAARRVS